MYTAGADYTKKGKYRSKSYSGKGILKCKRKTSEAVDNSSNK